MKESVMGQLNIISTPIGNLEDITLRALRTLKEADLIACEDTRHSQKLLNAYNITTPTISYHEHNEVQRSSLLIQKIKEGQNIALICDAGTPVISDPGCQIIQACIQEKIPFEWIPGPCALIGAKVLSGFKDEAFLYYGFLAPKKNQRQKELLQLETSPFAIIFYESCHRIRDTLTDIHCLFPKSEIVVLRELTKQFESIYRGSAEEILFQLPDDLIKGEIVFILKINQKIENWEDIPFCEHLNAIVEKTGLVEKEALYLLAQIRGITKREAYQHIKVTHH